MIYELQSERLGVYPYYLRKQQKLTPDLSLRICPNNDQLQLKRERPDRFQTLTFEFIGDRKPTNLTYDKNNVKLFFTILIFFNIIMISKYSFAIVWNFKAIPILAYLA